MHMIFPENKGKSQNKSEYDNLPCWRSESALKNEANSAQMIIKPRGKVKMTAIVFHVSKLCMSISINYLIGYVPCHTLQKRGCPSLFRQQNCWTSVRSANEMPVSVSMRKRSLNSASRRYLLLLVLLLALLPLLLTRHWKKVPQYRMKFCLPHLPFTLVSAALWIATATSTATAATINMIVEMLINLSEATSPALATILNEAASFWMQLHVVNLSFYRFWSVWGSCLIFTCSCLSKMSLK